MMLNTFSEVCWSLSFALLHMTWIGVLIGIAVWSSNRLRFFRSPSVRYWVNFGALILFAISFPIALYVVHAKSGVEVYSGVETAVVSRNQQTMSRLDKSISAVARLTRAAGQEVAASGTVAVRSEDGTIAPRVGLPHMVPIVAVAYVFGVAMMLLRLTVGIRYTWSLQQASRIVEESRLTKAVAKRAKQFALRVTPALATCERIAVPLVVGTIRPIVLLPTSMLSGFSAAELDLIIAHELAHLKRLDHVFIVVQRLLEAVLFFHPATWYLSNTIHKERENCCDDLVVACGVSRIEYANMLLNVVGLQKQANAMLHASTSLAADGNRPSKIRSRISRLFGETPSQDSFVSPRGLGVGLLFAVGMSLVIVSMSMTHAAQVEADPIRARISVLAEKSAQVMKEIKSCELKFRASSTGKKRIKDGLTLEDCRKLVEKFDIGNKPEQLRDLIVALSSEPESVAAQPWSEIELVSQGKKNKTIRFGTRERPNVHIQDGIHSLRFDAANVQLNIRPVKEEMMHQMNLREFLVPSRAVPPDAAGETLFRESDHSFHIAFVDPATNSGGEMAIGKSHGFVVSRAFSRAGSARAFYALGWSVREGGVAFPSAVVEFVFREGQLERYNIRSTTDVKFNRPLPTNTFVMGAIAGTNIIGAKKYQGRINHDVENVLSEEQLKKAYEPISDVLTEDDVAGVARAKKVYSLANGESLKRIAPPYPAARKYLSKLLAIRYAVRPGKMSSLIQADGENFKRTSSYSGGDFSARSILTPLTGVESTQVEGDAQLLDAKLPGDFVYQKGITEDQILDSMQSIIAQALNAEVRIEFRDVDRPVYVASGKMKLPPSNRIMMNGGEHDGDYGEIRGRGDSADALFSELSNYVGIKVVGDVEGPSKEFEISRRWYDIDSTKPEKRFDFQGPNVLKIISKQTGLEFTEQKQTRRILFVERGT